ncbi:hypothetical protein [Viridibacterium curvum]|uniref:Uncharacterized protein n=1 Tax=Viridibacterium curvum TaxID=1101404 RepID=A0ABP9QKU0_9RHOO
MMRKYGIWLALFACIAAVVWAGTLEDNGSADGSSTVRSNALRQGSMSRTQEPARSQGSSSAAATVPLSRIESALAPREAISKLRHDPFSAVSFAPPPPPPLPPPAPSAPPLRFKYQGQLREGNTPVVFLDNNGQMLIVREGDTVAGQYKVLRITDNAMQFEYLPLAQQQTLTFGR